MTDTVDYLRKTALFQDIPEEHIRNIASFSEQVSFLGGDVAMVEDSSEGNQDLYLLVSGELDISRKYSKMPTSKSMSIKQDSADEIFGEIAWLLGTSRSVGIRCRGRALFVRINRDQSFAYLSNHPEVGAILFRRISVGLAERLVRVTEQIKIMELVHSVSHEF